VRRTLVSAVEEGEHDDVEGEGDHLLQCAQHHHYHTQGTAIAYRKGEREGLDTIPHYYGDRGIYVVYANMTIISGEL
jgi:hypothetical protein